MGTGLARFVVNSVVKRMNDPANATFWLPRRLAEADAPSGQGKLLPLSGEDMEVGEVTGEAGATFRDTIKGQWWTTMSKAPDVRAHQPIADPQQPWPRLSFSELSIAGLENVAVLPDPPVGVADGGYAIELRLRSGAYGGESGLAQLEISGRYSLTQALASAAATAPAPATPDGWKSADIVGTGRFTATVTGVYLTVDGQLLVADADGTRQPLVRIDSFAVGGLDAATPAAVKVTQLLFDEGPTFMRGLWEKAAMRALQSPQGSSGLMRSMSDALNSQGNRDKVGEILSGQIADAIDGAMGKAPDLGPPSSNDVPVDTFVFDRLVHALNDPASGHYLPRLLGDSQDPVLDPYHIDSIALPDQSAMGLTLVEFRLEDVRATGIANARVLAGPSHLIPGGVDLSCALAALAIDCRFVTHLDDDPEPIPGSCHVQVNGPGLHLVVGLGGTEVADLTVTFQALALAIDPGALSIAAQVDSSFLDVFNKLLNAPGVKQQLIDGINNALAGQLRALDGPATDRARALIAQQLGG